MAIEPKISIIVAIYNQEKYLHKSLSSIQNNTFKDYEVLLINDGSTDRSEDICLQYCDTDSRFKYFKKANGGVASARQFGLDNCHGEYVIHVDPDDWVALDYLSELYKAAKDDDADMVMCDYIEEYEDNSKVVELSKFENLSIAELQLALIDGTLWGICWNKLIRRSIITEDIYFEPGIDFQEDRLFIYRALNKMNRIVFLPNPLYYYNRMNPNSMLAQLKPHTYLQYWKVKSRFVENFHIPGRERQMKKYVVRLNTIFDFVMQKQLDVNLWNEMISPFKYAIRYNSLFSRGYSPQHRIVSFLSTIKPLLRLIRTLKCI